MPNWCEGTLKVRGKEKDLKRFVIEALTPVGFWGNEIENGMTIDEDGYFSAFAKASCHIKGTRRGFVENLYAELCGDDDEVSTLCFETKFAWDIAAEPLAGLCNEFNVDMRIYAFEKGMEFNRDIEIVGGEIIKDNEIKFDDYEWECICPTMGG